MRASGHKAKVKRLEQVRAQLVAEEERHEQSGSGGEIPVTLEQLVGVKPMTERDGARLRAWMLARGWRVSKRGGLLEPRKRKSASRK